MLRTAADAGADPMRGLCRSMWRDVRPTRPQGRRQGHVRLHCRRRHRHGYRYRRCPFSRRQQAFGKRSHERQEQGRTRCAADVRGERSRTDRPSAVPVRQSAQPRADDDRQQRHRTRQGRQGVRRSDRSDDGHGGARRVSSSRACKMCSRSGSRSTGPSSTPGRTSASSTPSRRPDARSWSSPASGRRSVWRCRRYRRWARGSRSSPSPTLRAVSRRRPTTWPCGAWSKRAWFRSPGRPC